MLLRPCCRYMGVSSAHPSHEYDPVAVGASTLLPTPHTPQDQQVPQQEAADQQHQPRCGSPSRLAANLRKHSDEINKMQVGVAGGAGVGWTGQGQGGWVWQEGQAQDVERRWVWREGQV